MSTEQSADILAGNIRECIGRHMENFDAYQYKEMIASVVIALYVEVARIKSLSVQTGEVDSSDFDRVFMNGVRNHFEDKYRLESIN
jgi:hypothetical protein